VYEEEPEEREEEAHSEGLNPRSSVALFLFMLELRGAITKFEGEVDVVLLVVLLLLLVADDSDEESKESFDVAVYINE
jgi:hypothetical protein